MENKELVLKYTAIKLKGFDYWVWFETDKVNIDDYHQIVGKKGWGKGVALTNINVHTNQVEGQMWSDTLQYV